MNKINTDLQSSNDLIRNKLSDKNYSNAAENNREIKNYEVDNNNYRNISTLQQLQKHVDIQSNAHVLVTASVEL